MTMTKDQTCEQRIGTRMAGRLADMLAAVEAYEVGETDEDESLMEELRESVLSFDVRRSVRILLSTGGPADGFDVIIDEDGELVSGEYWFQDWFDGARRQLESDELALIDQVYGPFPSV